MKKVWYIIIAALLASAGSATAQSVGGRVLDAETRAGVAGVRVTLIRPGGAEIEQAVTDRDGRFTVRAKNSGAHQLRTQHIAYRAVVTDTFEIGGQEQVVVDITVTTAAVQLDPLTIVARRRDPRHDATEDGVYARRMTTPHIGNSRVILPHDPEMANALDARDVLNWFPRGRNCTVVYWNGHMVLDSTSARTMLEQPTSLLEAVEYYRTPQDAPIAYRDTPLYLQSNVFCQVVALWPRTGRYITVPPAPPLPDYHGYASIGAALTFAGGRQSPGIGAGAEATAHIPIRGPFGVAFNLRVTMHRLDAETTNELTSGMGALTFVLPPGDRSLRLITAGVEPRVTVLNRGTSRVTVGARVQVAQRSFTLERPGIGFAPVGMRSLAVGGGPAVAYEAQVTPRLALNATFAYEHLPFGEYHELERPGVRTSATWSAVTARVGLLFNSPW